VRLRIARCVVVAAAAAVILSTGAVCAQAWSNGPGGDGFGTHDWVLYQADRIAVARGYAWLDWPVAQKATDDPDTKLRDTRNHVYQLGARRYGSSPDRVAALYEQMLGELERGDRKAASYSMGLLAHYLADTNNPLHTDQVPAEEDIHSKYERAVERLAEEGVTPAWLRPTGLDGTVAPRELTVQAAVRAHRSYAELVDAFGAGGYSPRVDAITKTSLAAAVGDVESVLVMAGKAAAPAPAATSPPRAAASSPPSVADPASDTSVTRSPAADASATEEATGAGVPQAAPPPTGRSPIAVGWQVGCCCLGLLIVCAAAFVFARSRRHRRA
jgi:hypothetical protein